MIFMLWHLCCLTKCYPGNRCEIPEIMEFFWKGLLRNKMFEQCFGGNISGLKKNKQWAFAHACCVVDVTRQSTQIGVPIFPPLEQRSVRLKYYYFCCKFFEQASMSDHSMQQQPFGGGQFEDYPGENNIQTYTLNKGKLLTLGPRRGLLVTPVPQLVRVLQKKGVTKGRHFRRLQVSCHT